MSKAIVSPGQARSLIGSFTLDVPWEGLEADVQPFIELSPEERGKRFAAFIRNGFHLMVQERPEPAVRTPTAWTVDDDGNIHFSLTSNGMTCEQWEQHLERRGCRISDYARQVLRRASEAPTNGVTYNIVVRPGKKISDSDRITKKIRAAADNKGWVKPHWEVACLIRDTFTDEQLEQMGLWYIVTMHEPIKDSDGDPFLLRSGRGGDGRWLYAGYGRPDAYWHDDGGFAFAVPQVGPRT